MLRSESYFSFHSDLTVCLGMVFILLISQEKYSREIGGVHQMDERKKKVIAEDILDTERRQEDCLLAATGWIWEKSLECWESIAFQARRRRRKETRAWKPIYQLAQEACNSHTQQFSKSVQDDQNPHLQSIKYKWLNICTVNSNKWNNHGL